VKASPSSGTRQAAKSSGNEEPTQSLEQLERAALDAHRAHIQLLEKKSRATVVVDVLNRELEESQKAATAAQTNLSNAYRQQLNGGD
jgi:hypothetical protein